MEQNNFEKDIQRKLEELKIDPSDVVWKNVQKHIVKKDKKRRVLFILFFLFLFISLGGFWMFNAVTNKQERHAVIAKTLIKNSEPTNTRDSSSNKPGINPRILTNSDTTKAEYRNKKDQVIGNEKKLSNSKQIIFINESRKDSSKSANNQKSPFLTDNPNIFPLEKTFIANAKIKKEKPIIQPESKKDSLQTVTGSQKNNNAIIPKNDPAIKKRSKKVQKNRWTFGITVSGGSSFATRNHATKNAVYSSPSLNTSGYGIPGYYPAPSALRNSAGFQLGAVLEKNISDQNKISLGISYQYFSLVNKVGNTLYPSTALQYLNSSNNLYSGNNISHSFRNEFHFLEIPVSFNFRLNKNKSVPLFWNAGINISELISSNALQFQSNPGVYYNDNSFFNKTQFGLHTGFSVTAFSKEKIPLSVGPYFYYSPESIASTGLYSQTHFMYTGIQAKILFRKK